MPRYYIYLTHLWKNKLKSEMVDRSYGTRHLQIRKTEPAKKEPSAITFISFHSILVLNLDSEF